MKSENRPRTTFSFRINPEIKKDFLAIINEKRLNSCHILEALIVGWTEGIGHLPRKSGYTAGATLVFNQKFENVIARSRRESKVKGEFNREYKHADNCYSLKRGGVWFYNRPDAKDDLQKNGHHVFCECRDCKPSSS